MGDALGKLFVPLQSLPGLYSLPDDCVGGPDDLDPTVGGLAQLAFLASVYAYVLFQASNLIADGSELLLLIPEIAPIVGSVVIPTLGALPDSFIVLFSGLGDPETAQKQLSVGVGALAGSTIMLLTVPWTMSVLAGRVSISQRTGRCKYARPSNAGPGWKKLRPGQKDPLRRTGVEAEFGAMRSGARTMAVTSLSYFIIQGAAMAYDSADVHAVAAHEKAFALVGLVLCLGVFLPWYMISQVRGAGSDVVLQNIVDDKRALALKSGMLSLQGAFFNALTEFDGLGAGAGGAGAGALGAGGAGAAGGSEEHRHARFEGVVRRFFSQYDVNGDNTIDRAELQLLLTDLHIPHTQANMDHFMAEMDEDGSGDIHFGEFLTAMLRLLSRPGSPRRSGSGPGGSGRGLGGGGGGGNGLQYGSDGTHEGTSGQIRELMEHHEQGNGADVRAHISHQQGEITERLLGSGELPLSDSDEGEGEGDGDGRDGDVGDVGGDADTVGTGAEGDVPHDEDGEEEEEEVPADLADLSPAEQRKHILFRSARMMLTGTALVLVFSDPMVEVMSEIGEVCGIKAFYVSFILAPLASNASEFIASYNYALKKTSKTVTISLTSLLGAAIMNNTLCLGTFLALVYFRGLAWEFSAETLSILVVEAIMVVVAMRRVQTLGSALFVLTLFPASLVLVFVLENVFGFD